MLQINITNLNPCSPTFQINDTNVFSFLIARKPKKKSRRGRFITVAAALLQTLSSIALIASFSSHSMHLKAGVTILGSLILFYGLVV